MAELPLFDNPGDSAVGTDRKFFPSRRKELRQETMALESVPQRENESNPFDETFRAIRREWGLPINRRVRLTLKNLDSEIEGKLLLDGELERIDRTVPLRLKVGRTTFDSSEIETCTALD